MNSWELTGILARERECGVSGRVEDHTAGGKQDKGNEITAPFIIIPLNICVYVLIYGIVCKAEEAENIANFYTRKFPTGRRSLCSHSRYSSYKQKLQRTNKKQKCAA